MVQGTIGAIRAVGIATLTPWVMQRGPPTSSTARRVVNGLASAHVMDVTAAAMRHNVVALDHHEALGLLKRGCVLRAKML